ncbi:MAG: glycoside hydrolase family 28 protein [Armatimonadota bacterium]
MSETLNAKCVIVGETAYDIRDYGAVGDGISMDTDAIQTAIDACTVAGGGVVFVPAGVFLTGTIVLKDNVTLHLANTATILGSTDPGDYATGIARCGFEMEYLIDKCLIYAEEAENIAITGRGTIDGQGAAFPSVRTDGLQADRPMLMRCFRSRHILVQDVTLKNAGAWCSHFRECFDVCVTGVTIDNRVNGNNDGIDLMSTERVRISDCTIFCGDDAICFQNMSDDHPTQDIVITNCIMSTRWAAIRSGGAHRGGIRNVTVSNCVIKDTYGCGIKLQISGNGDMENMTFSNIVMENVSTPIALRFGNCHYNGEKRDETHPWGTMRNIMFSNIWASILPEADLKRALEIHGMHPNEGRQCLSICGIPKHPIEGVTMSDVHFIYPCGGTNEDAANLNPPEHEDDYPEYYMWGVLPAYGLYARHAKDLTLNNTRFEQRTADHRPAIVCDDVDGLDLHAFRADLSPEAGCLVRMRGTRNAVLEGCRILRSPDDPRPLTREF